MISTIVAFIIFAFGVLLNDHDHKKKIDEGEENVETFKGNR
ncbi:hypothetical protein LCGC14_0943610 [marine sediment metagenome]|uniref:Uncharacterized protein n=1 Tax=marine sediment metagenome TaxID=412755 RepID=A0A0F9P5E0_9ZZZZ